MSLGNKYLVLRNSTWWYQRAVPTKCIELDPREPLVSINLHTHQKPLAKQKRDKFAAADTRYWEALKSGLDAETALEKYQADAELARSLGLEYKQSGQLSGLSERQEGIEAAAGVENFIKMFGFSDQYDAADAIRETNYRAALALGLSSGKMDVGDVHHKLMAAIHEGDDAAEFYSRALLTSKKPKGGNVSDAFETYVEDIAFADYQSMNKAQFRTWRKTKQRAVNNFINVVSDKALLQISREEAREFYNFWKRRIHNPAPNSKPLSESAGDRDMGNMSVLFKSYAEHMGQEELDDPFRGLRFKGKARKKVRNARRKKRPTFTTEWIRNKIMLGDGLLPMNKEARFLVLLGAFYGVRPSEFCYLAPFQIHLDAEIPFVEIAEIEDGEFKRAVKSESSERELPLHGLALEIFKQFPSGFPRYRKSADNFTQQARQFMRRNGLMETPAHTLYSFRHTLENRMREANVGDDLRREIFGHTIFDRPEYGDPYALSRKLEVFEKIELPYNRRLLE